VGMSPKQILIFSSGSSSIFLQIVAYRGAW